MNIEVSAADLDADGIMAHHWDDLNEIYDGLLVKATKMLRLHPEASKIDDIDEVVKRKAIVVKLWHLGIMLLDKLQEFPQFKREVRHKSSL